MSRMLTRWSGRNSADAKRGVSRGSERAQGTDRARRAKRAGRSLLLERLEERAVMATAPIDLTMVGGRILENSATGTEVGVFSTIDPDAGDTFSYSLVSGTGSADNSQFSIQGDRLIAQAPFDFEFQHQLQIRVRSQDQGGLGIERQFTITVLNQDDLSLSTTVRSISQAEPENYIELGARVDPINDQSSSADGHLFVYSAVARNLVPDQVDRTGTADVFLFDRTDGSIRLVSHGVDNLFSSAAGDSRNPRISADGAYVAFESTASNLVAGQSATGQSQIYLYEVATGAITLVSRASTASTTPSNGPAQLASISADGGRLVFTSGATNLIANQSDSNSGDDVFLYDRVSNETRLVSHSTASTATTGSGRSATPRISADGQWVVFASLATNLAAGITDSNGQDDLWLYNVATTQLNLVSHSASNPTTAASSGSFNPSISADGGAIAFESSATNLATGQSDTNAARDVFRYSRASNSSSLVSHTSASTTTAGNGASTAAVISADGGLIAYQSTAKNLVASMTKTRTDEDIFLYSEIDNSSILASHSAADPLAAGNGRSFQPTISDDGSRVAFLTQASDLIELATDSNGTQVDAIVYDLFADASAIVSRAWDDPSDTADAGSDSVAIAGGGDYVFFTSLGADIALPILDNLSTRDAFVFEVTSGFVDTANRGDLLAPNTTSTGGGSSQFSNYAISDDDRYFVFTSTGLDLMSGTIGSAPVLGVGPQQVYLFDRFTFARTLVSHAANTPTVVSNGISSAPLVSGDGQFVAFQSTGTNLIGSQDDTNAASDVFLYNIATGAVTLVSRQSGQAARTANGASRPLAISQDGQFVLFASSGTNLIPNQVDGNGGEDIFLFDRVNGTTTLVTRDGANPSMTGGATTSVASMTADGQLITFASAGSNFLTGVSDVPGTSDVFLYRLSNNSITLVSRSVAGLFTAANGASTLPRINKLGTNVAFLSAATNLVNGSTDSNGALDAFAYNIATNSLRLVSHVPGNSLTAANGGAQDVAISGDGSFVAYTSLATNAVTGQVDSNNAADLFVYNLNASTTSLISGQLASATQTAGGGIGVFAIGDDGRYVVFESTGTGYVGQVPGGVGSREIYQFDSANQTTLLVTERPAESTVRNNALTGLDSSGEWAGFASNSELLADWDYNFLTDFFIWSTPFELPNAQPTDITLSATTVHEQEPIGTTVGTLGAIDPDTGDTFTFDLVAGPGGDDNASFLITGDILATNEVFQRDVKSTYHIRVRATDPADEYVEKAITITIVGDNAPATNISLSREGFFERLRGATVGTITATDADPGDTHTYTVSDARFTIVGDKLKLKDTEFLLRSNVTTVNLTLTATDSALNQFSKPFTLNVLANPTPWRNPLNGLDVNPDTFVVPQDALIIINELNSVGSYALPIPLEGSAPPPPYLDTDGDNFVAPIDALLIINFLNSLVAAEGEPAEGSDASTGDKTPVDESEVDESEVDENPGDAILYTMADDGASDEGDSPTLDELATATTGGGSARTGLGRFLLASAALPASSSNALRIARPIDADEGIDDVWGLDDSDGLDPLSDAIDELAQNG